MVLVCDMGMMVEWCFIKVDELILFDEVGCCGMVMVIVFVGTIQWCGQTIQYNGDGSEFGFWTVKFFEQFSNIQ